MKKNYPLFIFIFSLILLNSFLLFNSIKSKYNQNEYLRLHIVANSNSIDDQIIKLNVTKKINNYLSSLYKSYDILNYKTNKKENIKHIITNDINNILEVANNELINQKVSYSCYANIGKISYDEKKSDKINMESGIYDSIQLVLGEGKGENFWSLIFPYSYNENIDDICNITTISNQNIQIESKLINTLRKVVKTFQS